MPVQWSTNINCTDARITVSVPMYQIPGSVHPLYDSWNTSLSIGCCDALQMMIMVIEAINRTIHSLDHHYHHSLIDISDVNQVKRHKTYSRTSNQDFPNIVQDTFKSAL